jgi:hypothetical protein
MADYIRCNARLKSRWSAPGTSAVTIIIALLVLSPLTAQAIGSVTNGDVTFAYTNNFSSSNNNTVDTSFTGAATGNQTYESWWFFRVSGDGRETAFGAPTSESYGSSVGYLSWSDPGASGLFSAVLGFEVVDNGTDAGNLFQGLTVTNTSGADLIIDIFHYSDLEVGGGSSGDSAVLGSGASGIVIDVTDGADTAPIVGYGADNYWVTRWGGGGTLLRNLTDRNVDNFADVGLPFASNDITVGFQWSRTITAGQSERFLTQFGSNASLLPETYTSVPEPNLALLIGIGLVGLGRFGRDSA